MAKILRMTCTQAVTYKNTAQTAAIMQAIYKLFLSGISDAAVYKADPVCGAYCTSIGIVLESYGDSDVYPITAIDANNFSVALPNYSIRVSQYKYSSLHFIVGVVPYVSSPVGYYNAGPQPSYSNGTRTTTFTVSPDPIHMLNAGSLTAHPHTIVGNAVALDVSVFFGANTIAFGDNSGEVSRGSVFKRKDDLFVGASFSNGYDQASNLNQSAYKITLACLNPLTPVAPTVGSLSTNLGPLVSSTVNGNTTTTISMATNLPAPLLNSDATVKPILQLSFWSPLTGDVDLSEEGVLLYTMAAIEDYQMTVLNLGTTYRLIGGTFLVAS